MITPLFKHQVAVVLSQILACCLPYLLRIAPADVATTGSTQNRGTIGGGTPEAPNGYAGLPHPCYASGVLHRCAPHRTTPTAKQASTSQGCTSCKSASEPEQGGRETWGSHQGADSLASKNQANHNTEAQARCTDQIQQTVPWN